MDPLSGPPGHRISTIQQTLAQDAMTGNQTEFLSNLRRSLGSPPDAPPLAISDATALGRDAGEVARRAESIRERAQEDAEALADELERAAALAGWKVARVASTQDAAGYIADLVRKLEARSVVRSAQAVVERLDLEGVLSGAGVQVNAMAVGEGSDEDEADADEQRGAMRQHAIDADLGITGVDYAIAETGTCVLLPRKGISRLVSLLPPVHVAIVERGQVLPGLDEFFALRRADSLQSDLGSYMTLITGPSRSADIEYTIVTGVHGPGEVHMLLQG
jgi:L-lactate dehydrogenase complex protein LldG